VFSALLRSVYALSRDCGAYVCVSLSLSLSVSVSVLCLVHILSLIAGPIRSGFHSDFHTLDSFDPMLMLLFVLDNFDPIDPFFDSNCLPGMFEPAPEPAAEPFAAVLPSAPAFRAFKATVCATA
jgi:hypothetical protein